MAITKYTDREKADICAAWSLLGDDDAIADRYGVKVATLKGWKKQRWWLDLLEAMHSEHSQQLVAKANRAMSTALDELEDRLHRGDVKVVLTTETKSIDGEKVTVREPYQYREPVKARDLSSIINVLATRSEKAAQLTAQAEQHYQLSDLQSSFREFASSYRAKQVKDQTSINGQSRSVEHGSVEQGISTASESGQE